MSDPPIVAAAISWWESKRPFDWNEEQHLRNPLVNLATEEECDLALAIAVALVLRGEQNTGKEPD